MWAPARLEGPLGKPEEKSALAFANPIRISNLL